VKTNPRGVLRRESKGEESGVKESDRESGVGLGDSEGEERLSENSDDVPLPGWRK